MRLGFPCPYCEARSTAVKTKRVSVLSIEVGYRCTNLDCGHTFVAVIEAIRSLSPSAYARPDVNLPISRHVRRKWLTTQLDRSPVAAGGALDDEPACVANSNLDLFEEGAFG